MLHSAVAAHYAAMSAAARPGAPAAGASIAFYAHKGGVGKSTLIFDAAFSLAIDQKRDIVIIDADSQLNTTFKLLGRMKADINDTLIDALLEQTAQHPTVSIPMKPSPLGGAARQPIVVPTLYTYMCGVPYQFDIKQFTEVADTDGRVRFLLGSPILHTLEGQLTNAIKQPQQFPGSAHLPQLFYKLLIDIKAAYAAMNKSVLIMVDMSPSASMMNQNVLLSCDHLVLPCNADDNSMVSLRLLFNFLHRWRTDHTGYLPANHNIKFQFVVLNRYKIMSVADKSLTQMGKLFEKRIGDMIAAFQRAQANQVFIPPNHRAALLKVQDGMRFMALTSEACISVFEITNDVLKKYGCDPDEAKVTSLRDELLLLGKELLKRV
jgi:cellulose biosynthesis protein BcsQ